jgi:hypothetical protein
MELPQAPAHGRGKIGAAPHSFCQDDFSPKLLDQSAGMDGEFGKTTAEAAAPDFFRRKTQAANQRGIDQLVPLIVGDDSNPHAASD